MGFGGSCGGLITYISDLVGGGKVSNKREKGPLRDKASGSRVPARCGFVALEKKRHGGVALFLNERALFGLSQQGRDGWVWLF